MAGAQTDAIIQLIHQTYHPFNDSSADLDPIIERIADRPFVLIGEASHGTHEFYEMRAALTRRLIEEKGFTAVAAEADWPDAWRASAYAQGEGPDPNASEALGGFKRFPTWMWRNTVVEAFIDWLRAYNARSQRAPVGFYGLDLYSLHASIQAVLDYLEKTDPEAARRARYRYACFDQFGENPQAYGYAANFGLTEACEQAVVAQLVDMTRQAGQAAQGGPPQDAHFYATQNARVVKDAEHYYRSMFRGNVMSWNLRDQHMAETLDALVAHQRAQGLAPKVVLWEHNSHLGDARATYMKQAGKLNVGQLVREKYHEQAYLLGFTTYTGSVTAADEWGGETKFKQVNPGLAISYEGLFHDVGAACFFLPLTNNDALAHALKGPLLERAIGVIYLPQSERISHYFDAHLPQQFNGVIHLEHTRALKPLDHAPYWRPDEVPETYPEGI